MKTMMKILALIMALAMVMCLVACGNDSKNDDGAGTDGTTEPSSTVTVPNGNGGSEDNNSQPADDGKKEYKIVVKDSNGVALSGVLVQICKEGSTCFTPARTDVNGCAVWKLDEASDYYGTVSSLEEGMPKEYFEGNFEVTLVYDPEPVNEA